MTPPSSLAAFPLLLVLACAKSGGVVPPVSEDPTQPEETVEAAATIQAAPTAGVERPGSSPRASCTVQSDTREGAVLLLRNLGDRSVVKADNGHMDEGTKDQVMLSAYLRGTVNLRLDDGSTVRCGELIGWPVGSTKPHEPPERPLEPGSR